MIVTCPNCGTKFEIPDDKYRPGRKARCSNCGNIFPLPEHPEQPGQGAPAAEPAQAPTEDSTNSSAQQMEKAADDQNKSSSDGQGEAPPASVDDAVLAPQKKKFRLPFPNLANKKKILLSLGIAGGVLLLIGSIFFLYSVFFSSGPPEKNVASELPKTPQKKMTEAETKKEAARLKVVRLLALNNVRQYLVKDNEKTGPILVVEGEVVNNFDTPKSLVLIEVTLFDNKGEPIAIKEQYCGVVLSLLQLRTLPEAAIRSALANQVTIFTNNTDILPGKSVPFSTVFFNLPNEAYELEVKIIDVQNPAPDPTQKQ